jgi:hypothetical protein
MQPSLILQLLILLLLANGTPVIVKRVLGSRLSYPIDGGVGFLDGQRLFGPTKTVRGVLSAMVATSVSAPIIGLDWIVGLMVGSGAMAGDLISSFMKRRLHLAPSSRATGLDQIPESLLPLLFCWSLLALTLADVVITVALFFIGEILLSRLLYKLRIRGHPY